MCFVSLSLVVFKKTTGDTRIHLGSWFVLLFSCRGLQSADQSFFCNSPNNQKDIGVIKRGNRIHIKNIHKEIE